MRTVVSVIAVALVLFPVFAHPQDITAAKGICYDSERLMNLLVDFTETKCIPARTPNKETLSLLIVSSQPIFAVESAKKGYLLAAVGALGYTLNSNPKTKVDEVWFSDVQNVKKLKVWMVSVDLLRSLQRRIKSDNLTLKQGWSELSRSLSAKNISRIPKDLSK